MHMRVLLTLLRTELSMFWSLARKTVWHIGRVSPLRQVTRTMPGGIRHVPSMICHSSYSSRQPCVAKAKQGRRHCNVQGTEMGASVLAGCHVQQGSGLPSLSTISVNTKCSIKTSQGQACTTNCGAYNLKQSQVITEPQAVSVSLPSRQTCCHCHSYLGLLLWGQTCH